MENPITLTITPSNQEDFMDSLARKVIERGITDEMMSAAIDSVKDNIDYDDIRETALEDLDVRDIRQEVIDDIDYLDMAGSVLEEIDLYSLASDVADHMDTESLIDALDVQTEVDNMIKNTLTDHLENYSNAIADLKNEISDLHQDLFDANTKIAILQRDAKRSLFSRIFGG